MTRSYSPLSKEVVHRTFAPHLGALGQPFRERLEALLEAMQPDGGISLADALNIIDPHISNEIYEPALTAFHQFCQDLKKRTREKTGLCYVLKHDVQNQAQLHQRWCWFEDHDRFMKEVALFSAAQAAMVDRSTTIHQTAIAMKIDEPLPDFLHGSDGWSVTDCENVSQLNVVAFLEAWGKHKERPYCALLGEYGMGKTVACIQLTQNLLEKRKSDPSFPLPIYLDLRNLSHKSRVHEMEMAEIVDSILQASTYSAKGPLRAEQVIQLIREENTLVIFDSLDEVLVHLSNTEGQCFTEKLLNILSPDNDHKKPSSQVLIACRTHYFRTMRDQRVLFATEEHTGIHAEDYYVLMLLPFALRQIREFLKQALPQIDTDHLLELIRSVHNLSELAERPYTLSLISSLIPEVEQWKEKGIPITGVTIYRHVVLSWLERDNGKHTLTIDHKQQLMEYFAAELWRSGKRYWNITDVENWFVQFMMAQPAIAGHYVLCHDENRLNLVLETMKDDLRTATFLVRIGESDFCFAHSSLQEFFLATYLHRALTHRQFKQWDLSVVSRETLGFLGQLLSEEDSPEAIETLCVLRDTYRPRMSELAFAYMMFAHSKGYPAPSLRGFHLENANLQGWTIGHGSEEPGHAEEPCLDLREASFHGACLQGACLNRLNLEHADFSEAHLNDSEIRECEIRFASFDRADLTKAFLMNTHFEYSTFSNARLYQSEWVRCYLDGCTTLPFQSPDVIFVRCHPLEDHVQISNAHPDRHNSVISACAFSPEGNRLASASWDKTARIWDIETGKCIQRFDHEGFLYECAYTPDGNYLLTAGDNKTVRIWNIQTGELKTFTGHTDIVRSAVSSPSGAYYASASYDQTVRIWEAHTGVCLHVLTGHTNIVTDCRFSPDGRYVVSSSYDKTLRIWDSATGECLRELKGHTSWIRRAAYSPCGDWLASASGDKTVRLWNAQSGECLYILSGHEERVRGCVFSPDGKYLASSSDDQTVRIWDIETGQCSQVLQGHQNRVKGCAFSSSGLLASVSDDLTLRLWSLSTGECIKILGQI